MEQTKSFKDGIQPVMKKVLEDRINIFNKRRDDHTSFYSDPLFISILNRHWDSLITIAKYCTDGEVLKDHLNRMHILYNFMFGTKRTNGFDTVIAYTILNATVFDSSTALFRDVLKFDETNEEKLEYVIQDVEDIIFDEFSELQVRTGINKEYTKIEFEEIVQACYNTVTVADEEFVGRNLTRRHLVFFTNNIISLYGAEYGIEIATALLKKLKEEPPAPLTKMTEGQKAFYAKRKAEWEAKRDACKPDVSLGDGGRTNE